MGTGRMPIRNQGKQARGQPDKNPQDTRHTRVHAAPQPHEAGAEDRKNHGEVGDVANEKNLIPFDRRTETEQREIRSAGGIASGVSRRRKRSLKEAADLYLSLPVSDQRKWNRIARRGVGPEDVDNQMAMIIGLADAAASGDARAAKVLIDLLGEEKGAGGEAEGVTVIIDV